MSPQCYCPPRYNYLYWREKKITDRYHSINQSIEVIFANESISHTQDGCVDAGKALFVQQCKLIHRCLTVHRQIDSQEGTDIDRESAYIVDNCPIIPDACIIGQRIVEMIFFSLVIDIG